jgi:hypothetical protein
MGTVHEAVPHIVYAVGRVTPGQVNLLGTAFVVGKGLLATTQHVVGGDERNLVLLGPRITKFSEYQDACPGEVSFTAAAIHAIDPVRDICILRIEGDLSPNYDLGTADLAPPGTEVTTFGFPHADHGRLVLTQQNTAVGARVLIEASGIKSKHIVLNTQARPGQSGGPIFLKDSLQVAAMLIGSYAPGGGGGISLGGVDPHTLHQTTHAVSAEYIKDMV